MDQLWPVISHPFSWGLGLGLLVAVFVLSNALTVRREKMREIKRLREELDRLQQHLSTHLKITATGNDRLEKDLAGLREQNENLRVNLQASQQRPGRAEVRHLQVLEAAVARMRERAPGFAPAWEQALREATAERDASESGLSKFMRKVIPSGSPTAQRPALAEESPPKLEGERSP